MRFTTEYAKKEPPKNPNLQFASPRVAMAGREFGEPGRPIVPLFFPTEKSLPLPGTSPRQTCPSSGHKMPFDFRTQESM